MKSNKETIITIFFCLLSCLIVFMFFSHTLSYSWKNYDEHILFDETILPIPASFSEIFEIIRMFGTTHHFESANPIYSNISNMRGTPLDTLFCLIIFWLFKKSAFAYHLFLLTLHTINTCLCFLIINKISSGSQLSPLSSIKLRLLFTSALTLIWALHPAGVEAILLSTNFGALITYFFCLLFLLYFLHLNQNTQNPNSLLLFLVYLIPLFLNEYSITLPIILLLYLFASNLFHDANSRPKEVFFAVLKKTLPLFLALGIFTVYFVSHLKLRTLEVSSSEITLERIFWFSPQIFVHYLKLIFFPINLSIDQTGFVKFSNHYLHPYALSCSFLMYSLIFLSIISLFCIKKRIFIYLFVLFGLFLLSLFPFLHLVAPVYNLASERYLYFPLFVLIFGFAHIIIKNMANTVTLVILLALLSLLSTRTYARTLDWKDNFSLLEKTIETAPNKLYKGMRQYMIADVIKIPLASLENYKKATLTLKHALKDFKSEEKKSQNNIPKIIKFYGLDPKTQEAKAAFLTSLCEIKISGDPEHAYKIFSPYVKEIPTLSTLILDFYNRILFNTGRIEEAEKMLNKTLKQNKISPILFVALSDLSEYKYKNLKLTKKYLHQSFKYFPYDEATLFGLKRLYKSLNKPEQFAHYSYLYGLRTHDRTSLEEAALVYIALKKQDLARRVLKKLQKENPNNPKTQELQKHYEQIFSGVY